jgi:DNA repair exonuclease SbcCD nuclease subunit
VTHIIHTADWQIGRQYGQFDGDDAAMLAEARYEAVGRIAALAAERDADAVLVAGDVFDTQAVSDRSIRRVFDAMSAFAGPWVMIAGNHDAALIDSVWSRAHQLGCIAPNIHIPLRPGVVDLPQQNLAVLAAPLTQRHTYDDTTAVFDGMESQPGRVRIGLAHGSVTGRLPDSIDSANPIAADRASRANLHYLALGDWHGTLRIDARTWYAGTPEPDRFRSNDNGNVLDVRIHGEGAEPDVQVVPMGRYRWSLWSESLTLASDAEALAHRLQAIGAQDVLRLDLSGHLPLQAWDALQEAIARAAARSRVLLLDNEQLSLTPAHDDLSALGASGYVAEVAAQLQALQDDPVQSQTARHALRLLVQFQRAHPEAA